MRANHAIRGLALLFLAGVLLETGAAGAQSFTSSEGDANGKVVIDPDGTPDMASYSVLRPPNALPLQGDARKQTQAGSDAFAFSSVEADSLSVSAETVGVDKAASAAAEALFEGEFLGTGEPLQLDVLFQKVVDASGQNLVDTDLSIQVMSGNAELVDEIFPYPGTAGAEQSISRSFTVPDGTTGRLSVLLATTSRSPVGSRADHFASADFDLVFVPEPGEWVGLLAALAGLGFVAARKRVR